MDKRLTYLIVFVLVIQANLYAQTGYRFNHYAINTSLFNPASCGVKGYSEVFAGYRGQWSSLKGSPKSILLNASVSAFKSKVGLGLSVLNDEVGISAKREIYASYAYHIKADHSIFSMGLNFGIENFSENWQNIVTTQPDDPEFPLDNRKFWGINFGLGIHYATKKFFVGASIPKLLEDNYLVNTSSFYVPSFNIKSWHYYFTGGYRIPLSFNLELVPTFLIRTVRASPVNLNADLNLYIKGIVLLGAGIRSSNTWVGNIGFSPIENFMVYYSYDITSFSDFSGKFGASHEITLAYGFKKVNKKIISPRYF